MKFKKGDKLKIPKQKSTDIPLEESSLMNSIRVTGQDYCYVTFVDETRETYTVSHELRKNQSKFLEQDLELYDSEAVNNNYSIF